MWSTRCNLKHGRLISPNFVGAATDPATASLASCQVCRAETPQVTKSPQAYQLRRPYNSHHLPLSYRDSNGVSADLMMTSDYHIRETSSIKPQLWLQIIGTRDIKYKFGRASSVLLLILILFLVETQLPTLKLHEQVNPVACVHV